MRNEHTDKEIVDVLHHNFPRIYNRIYDYLESIELEYGDGEPDYIYQKISDKEIVDILFGDFPRIFTEICDYLDEEVSHG